DEHLLILDGARAGDHRERLAAERGVGVAAADVHDRSGHGELARRQLVGFEHGRDRLDAGDGQERNALEQRLVANAADDRALLAAREVGAHTDGLDALANVVDLGVGDVGAGDDDHRNERVTESFRTQTKTTRAGHGSLAWMRSLSDATAYGSS